MLGAGSALIEKGHTSTHEEVEANAMVSNKERVGPEEHSDDCALRRRDWPARPCSLAKRGRAREGGQSRVERKS